ncbi:head-tail connector protein [Sphingomonas azotifigens]|uniref:head-tail connector protein n=1 Tax=Sphingomonas azotifigens TaxID=330920 RepID=UPI000A001449|nr:head-tail connector protein [Sphingomonas azotifigens]
MTIDQMRAIVGLPDTATNAEIVAAYAALVDDGPPLSLPVVEPVTVEQVRLHCKIEEDEEDDLIAQKIRSAREWVEGYTGRVVAQRTLVQYARTWGAYLTIDTRPVVSIDSIAYNGIGGDATISDAAYSLGPSPTRIYPPNHGWPALRNGGAVTVVYTAGYAVGEAPSCMIEAIIVLVAGMLDERAGAYDNAARAAERLLGPRPPAFA